MTLYIVFYLIIVIFMFFFFFFSSRRRHTRFDCDWSSDVCSSDLSTSRRTIRRCSSTGGSASPLLARPARTTCSNGGPRRSEEHTSELQSQSNLVCRLLLEKKKRESI